MTGARENRHGTAIVIGTTGLIFIGPSGAGKSSTAHACLAAAAREGLFACLIADDQVFLRSANGRILAERPQTIRDRMELRGTGLVSLPSIAKAELHAVIAVDRLSAMERLAPDAEQIDILPGHALPLFRLACEMPDPLAALARLIPFRGLSGRPFR